MPVTPSQAVVYVQPKCAEVQTLTDLASAQAGTLTVGKDSLSHEVTILHF